MVEMKSGEVVLSLAAQLASWRAVLVLVRTWATCKPWQRKDFHQYSIFLADCLNQSKQTVWESAGGATATESRKVGKGRRKRRYADVDGPGANPEPELGPRGPTLKKQSKQTVWRSAGGAAAAESRKVGKGRRKRRYADVDGHGAMPEPALAPRGPTLKKQVRKGFDWLDLRLGLQPADSVDITQDFEWERETAARDKDSASEESSWGKVVFSQYLLDPAGSPSSIRKMADTTRTSSSAAVAAPTVPRWRSFFCLGNGK